MKLDCKEASSEKNSVGDSCVCKSLDGPVPILSLQLILFPGQLVMMPARCAFQMCRWNCLFSLMAGQMYMFIVNLSGTLRDVGPLF